MSPQRWLRGVAARWYGANGAGSATLVHYKWVVVFGIEDKILIERSTPSGNQAQSAQSRSQGVKIWKRTSEHLRRTPLPEETTVQSAAAYMARIGR